LFNSGAGFGSFGTERFLCSRGCSTGGAVVGGAWNRVEQFKLTISRGTVVGGAWNRVEQHNLFCSKSASNPLTARFSGWNKVEQRSKIEARR
jgi:hypothetical protein